MSRVLCPSRASSAIISPTTGRLVIPMKLGNYQRGMLARAKSVQGGVLTKGPRGRWYIHLSLRVGTPEPPGGGGRVVGADLGQNILATLSGRLLKGVRIRYRNKRAEIQNSLDTQRTRGIKRL